MKAVVVVFALLIAGASTRPHSDERNNRCSGVKDGTKYPNMNDCHKYVECSNGKELQKSCKELYKFDAVSLKCSDKSGVSCFHAPTTTTTTTTTKKPTTTTTRKPTTTTTKQTTTKKPATTTTASPTTTPVPTCNSRFALNCTMYWSCGSGEPTLNACLDGYIFYEPLRSCLPGDLQTCELYHI